MSRSPDQDVVLGLELAQEDRITDVFEDEGLSFFQSQGEIVIDVWDDAPSLDPDQAESMARILIAWAGRRRELDAGKP